MFVYLLPPIWREKSLQTNIAERINEAFEFCRFGSLFISGRGVGGLPGGCLLPSSSTTSTLGHTLYFSRVPHPPVRCVLCSGGFPTSQYSTHLWNCLFLPSWQYPGPTALVYFIVGGEIFIADLLLPLNATHTVSLSWSAAAWRCDEEHLEGRIEAEIQSHPLWSIFPLMKYHHYIFTNAGSKPP